MIFAIILVAITLVRFFEKKKLNDKLNVTLDNLRSTQKQLIQSEKMASLGELTAGIAHEIQNPLNFVNNFAEVSEEILDEIAEELAAGNTEDVVQLLSDIRQNLSKINHHGRRADSIIKGMLQHSRGSSGKMEEVDFNSFIQEFVNLSFHGMRAGKSPINVDIVFDLDNHINKVPLIS
jgi:C4-dicarboxylate-specific signal transduction histidine kinase